MHLVHMKLHPESQAVFRYTLQTAPDSVSNKHFPGVTVRPEELTILLTPDAEGSWYVRSIHVFGQEIVDGKAKQRKRLAGVPFMDPLDSEVPDHLPDWLKEIAEHHVLLMNDGSPELRERQEEAAREASRKMLAMLAPGDTGTAMADEVADNILNAMRRVG